MFGSFVQRCNDLNKKYPAKSGFWRMIEEYQAAPVSNTRTVVNRYNPSVPSVRPSAPSAPSVKKEYVLPKSAAYTPWYKDILENATHLLIAGETGSGKSVVLNGILHTALALYAPGEMSFCLIDPKMVELSPYEDLPHTVRYETEPEDVLSLLRDVYDFMMKRYEEMTAKRLKKYDGAKLVIVIDELADLLLSDCGKEIKKEIIKLLQKGRAANIMLICATQAPSRKVLSAELLLNMTNRIGLHCSNAIESKQIVGEKGAESLPAHGSALYKAPNTPVRRVDSIPFFTDEELKERINYWLEQ